MTIELGTQDALTLAKELALKSDAHATTFIGVFKRSYASDKLDLDLHSSLLVARHLSIDYKGDVAIALEDYEAITSYCIDPDKIGLAKPQCAQLAGKIAKLGENFKKPMAPSFFAAMEFMRDELKVNVKEALDLSYRIVKVSPDAVENFKIAYLYGLKERGLALDAKSSLEFAIQIADRSVKKLSSDRVPASH